MLTNADIDRMEAEHEAACGVHVWGDFTEPLCSKRVWRLVFWPLVKPTLLLVAAVLGALVMAMAARDLGWKATGMCFVTGGMGAALVLAVRELVRGE
jgi:hypothetical protein